MESRLRLRRVAGGFGLLLAAGIVYALWVEHTGLAFPCAFRTLTHLMCPGCGATRLCLALLQCDLAGAWQANPALLVMLPVLAALAARLSLRYVQEGTALPQGWERPLVWALLALLLAWGVARNII